MSHEPLIAEIGRRLAELTPANSEILLFGSRARGNGHSGSDVDILVIEPTVDDAMQESARLRRGLRGLGVPIDVLVIARAEAVSRAAVPGTLVERARREGRVLVGT